MNTTPYARSAKMYLLTPLSRNMGKNTTEVVTVAAKTGSATSVPPSLAAFSGEAPSSMKRKMFSSTITELSIKRDSTSASPPNNIVLIDPPMPLTISRLSAPRAEWPSAQRQLPLGCLGRPKS